MVRRLPVLLLLLLVSSGARASAITPDSPVGLWWNAERTAKIEISQRDSKLVGTVVWLKERRPDGGQLLDDANPDPRLRGRPLLGLEILQDINAEPRKGKWEGGFIYDPDTGKTYRCHLTLDERGGLMVRGFIGFSLVGRTTVWTRLAPTEAID